MDATKFFKQHPSKAEVFQTSDGTLFHLECDAQNHAKSLSDKNVKRVTNSNAKPVKPATATVASDEVIGEKESGETPAKAKTEDIEDEKEVATEQASETPVKAKTTTKTTKK